MGNVAINIEGLGKRYKLGATIERGKTFRELIMEAPARIYHSLKNNNGYKSYSKKDWEDPDTPPGTFWALRDLDLEVKHGDVLGIIGPNGAGKSTLLKLLSKITSPTKGRAIVHGRVGSLLEVGTGFHQELTGKENIYLNGVILGMKKYEIDRKFDEIVDFSGCEKFLDTPVKRFSSGMLVRLAFSVAAHLEPEILVVDEVLAVGDAEFQKKCLGKMQEVSHEGRTVLFVSHNMGAVRSLCDKGLLLHNGKKVIHNEVADVIGYYLNTLSDGSESAVLTWEPEEAPGNDYIRLLQAEIFSETSKGKIVFETSESINIKYTYKLLRKSKDLRIGLKLYSPDGDLIFASTDQSQRNAEKSEPGIYTSNVVIPGKLLNTKNYRVSTWAGIPGLFSCIPEKELFKISIIGKVNNGSRFIDRQSWPGAICPELKWIINKMD